MRKNTLATIAVLCCIPALASATIIRSDLTGRGDSPALVRSSEHTGLHGLLSPAKTSSLIRSLDAAADTDGAVGWVLPDGSAATLGASLEGALLGGWRSARLSGPDFELTDAWSVSGRPSFVLLYLTDKPWLTDTPWLTLDSDKYDKNDKNKDKDKHKRHVAVPEPGMSVLLLGGLLALVWNRVVAPAWRRRVSAEHRPAQLPS